MTYQWLRTFADSWGLLLMLLIYLGLVGWAFRPGGRRANTRAATSIFEEREGQDG